VCTIVTVYAISKISGTVSELKKSNKKVKINSCIMLLHSVILILNCFLILFLAVVPGPSLDPSDWIYFYIVYIVGDCIVQLCICLIVWIMGSSVDLRIRFNLTLVVETDGSTTVRLTR
jgi:hypothetical protein